MRPSVLIVDESSKVRKRLEESFDTAGFAVTVAESVAAARGALAATSDLALVLLGVIRPDGDGAALLAELKSAPATSATPVLLLSSEPDDASELVARARALIGRRQELAVAHAALLAELQQKNAALVQANRLKTEFLANMSHELRTPLNSIIGFTEVLIDDKLGGLNEQQRRYLTNVHQSGRHLLRLINDLLDQSKIEAGRLEVARQRCASRHITYEALMTVQPMADAKEITLVADARDVGRLPFVSGDTTRFLQVIYNLLANAIKLAPAGGRVEVRSELCDDGQRVRTTVTDTGPGIAADEMARLFTPFMQLPGTREQHVTGTGLGLALSKNLVELMGGRIGAESEPGRGASFWVELPIYDDDAADGTSE